MQLLAEKLNGRDRRTSIQSSGNETSSLSLPVLLVCEIFRKGVVLTRNVVLSGSNTGTPLGGFSLPLPSPCHLRLSQRQIRNANVDLRGDRIDHIPLAYQGCIGSESLPERRCRRLVEGCIRVSIAEMKGGFLL